MFGMMGGRKQGGERGGEEGEDAAAAADEASRLAINSAACLCPKSSLQRGLRLLGRAASSRRRRLLLFHLSSLSAVLLCEALCKGAGVENAPAKKWERGMAILLRAFIEEASCIFIYYSAPPSMHTHFKSDIC